MTDKELIITFINKINHDEELAKRIYGLSPCDWNGFSKIAQSEGFDVTVNGSNFFNACASSKVKMFCTAMTHFANKQLYNFKM